MSKNDPFAKALTEDAKPEDVLPVVEVKSEPDPLEVINADPRYDYLWASLDENHPQSWVAAQSRGWRLVSKVGGKETNPYGQTIFRTLVLMRRPKETREALDNLKKRRTADQIWRAEKELERIQEKAESIAGESGAIKVVG